MTIPQTVSVVIPVYNAGKYVADCLTSVISQTHKPYEIIVINDGSTDDTLTAIQPFANHIQLHSQANQGLSHTLNEGISRATGTFVAFIDADDWWVPQKLALQVAHLQQHPDLDACFGHVQQFISPELPPAVQAGIACPDGPQPGWFKQTMLIRRAAFGQTGLFDPTYTVGDFIDWFMRAKDAGLRYAMLPQVLTHRRLHRSGLVSQTQHHYQFARMLKAHLDRQKSAPDSP